MTQSLHKFSNDALISNLKNLVAQEREMLLQILKYLKEVENRGVHLKMGFPSLHAFLTDHLGYSEGAAHRRILAMRLMKSVPEVAPKIQKGELSLSVASQVQGFIQREEKQRKIKKESPIEPKEKLVLLESLQGTSSRECERQLVKLAPETALPREKTRPLTEEKSLVQFVAGKELIRKLERLKSLTSHTNPEGKYEILLEKLADFALEKLDPIQRAKRREQREQRKLQQVSEVSGKDIDQENSNSITHANAPTAVNSNAKAQIYSDGLKIKSKKPNGLVKSPRELGENPKGKGADLPLHQTPAKLNTKTPAQEFERTSPKNVEPNMKNGGFNSSGTQHQAPTPAPEWKDSRHIPQPFRDYIFRRDQGSCQYRDPKTGRLCGATHQIELDHRYPYSLGGEGSAENLRVLCRVHNQFRYGELK